MSVMKRMVKKAGKTFFVRLRQEGEGIFKQRVLVVDNGYATNQQLTEAIAKVKEHLPQDRISVLTFEFRNIFFQREFPDAELIYPDEGIKINRYRIAIQMFKLRKGNYRYIVLLSLDITPIIVALLFTKARVLLYNRYHQWWSLRQRTVGDFLRLRRCR
jgi:hypothetical protein